MIHNNVRSVVGEVKLLAAKDRSIKIGLMLFAVAVALLASSPLAQAGTGTINVRVAKAGLLVGFTRADGFLHFDGRDYRLSVSGITAGTVGVGFTRLRGHAYHIRSPADVVGNYIVTSVSASVVGGRKVARLQNSSSIVYLQLEGPEIGFELTAGVSGVTVSLP